MEKRSGEFLFQFLHTFFVVISSSSRCLVRLLSCGEMASTTTVTTTTTNSYQLNDFRRRKGRKGPPNLAKVGRLLKSAKVVSSATKKNCETHGDVTTDDDVNDAFLEDEDEWTKEDVNDKKEDREESGSIGGDDATKTKRSTTRGRTTTTKI